MAAHQAPPSLRFSRQEHWSGLPFPSPMHESEKWKWSRSVVSDSSRPHGLQPTRLLCPWDFPGKSTGVGCHCLLRCILSLAKMGCWWLFVGWGLLSLVQNWAMALEYPNLPSLHHPLIPARSPGNLYSLKTKCSKRILLLNQKQSTYPILKVNPCQCEEKPCQQSPLWAETKKKAGGRGQEYLLQWPKSCGPPSQGRGNISWAWNQDRSYPSIPCKHCHPKSGSAWDFRSCLIFLEYLHAKDKKRLGMCSGTFSYFKSSMSIAH